MAAFRLGVIGYGRRIHGLIHGAFREVEPDLRLVGVVDPDEGGVRERLAELGPRTAEGVRFHDGVAALLREARPDAVAIGTRCNLHTPIADGAGAGRRAAVPGEAGSHFHAAGDGPGARLGERRRPGGGEFPAAGIAPVRAGARLRCRRRGGRRHPRERRQLRTLRHRVLGAALPRLRHYRRPVPAEGHARLRLPDAPARQANHPRRRNGHPRAGVRRRQADRPVVLGLRRDGDLSGEPTEPAPQRQRRRPR